MSYAEHAPGPELRPWVECLWTKTVADDAPPRRRLVLPDGCADILVSLGTSFGPADRTPATWVVGAQRRPLDVRVPPGTVIVAVRFRPGGGGAFLGLPLRETRDTTVPLSEIWPRRADQLLGPLAGAADATRPARLRELLRGWRPSRRPDPLTEAAVNRILSCEGRIRIADLAGELGTGSRRLQRRFANDVGLSPKRLCRIVRARLALRLASSGTVREPLDLVARCGYHDQSHLTRELRELAGTTPGRLLSA